MPNELTIYEQPRFLDVPEYTWIKLAKAAKSENVSRQAGDTCSLLKGGSVEIIGTDSVHGTLVRYSLPAGERAAGALCPDGALMFLSAEQVATWPGKGVVTRSMQVEAEHRAEAVERLLSGRP